MAADKHENDHESERLQKRNMQKKQGRKSPTQIEGERNKNIDKEDANIQLSATDGLKTTHILFEVY